MYHVSVGFSSYKKKRDKRVSLDNSVDGHTGAVVRETRNPVLRSKRIAELGPSSLKTEEWMTTDEAAAFLRVSTASLLNLSSNGKIPYYKFQRRNRYLKSDLLALLLSSRKGAISGN